MTQFSQQKVCNIVTQNRGLLAGSQDKARILIIRPTYTSIQMGSWRCEALARVGLERCFFAPEERGTPILCGKDSKHRWDLAIPVPRIGCDDYAVNTTAHHLSLPGHRRQILGSDPEPAMTIFKRGRLLFRYDMETIPEGAHLSSSSNSFAVNLCQTD